MSNLSPPLYLLALLFLSIVMVQTRPPARVLIYSATAGFRHDSIPTAISALRANGSSMNVNFDSTEDRAQFTIENLSQYDALLFLSTTGEILDDEGKAAFQTYLNLGGNFIGVHSSSDSLVNTTFYGREIGAYFDYHPELQDAIVDVLDNTHPSTSMLPAAWHVRDEMYNFKSDPRTVGAFVLIAANESSYIDNGTRKFNQGKPHPLAWYQLHGSGADPDKQGLAGRSFYTSLGHLNETWQDQLFLSHVLGGVSWALQGNTTRAMNPSASVGNTVGQNQSSSSSISGSPTTVQSPQASTSQPSDAIPNHLGVTIFGVAVVAVIVGLAQHLASF